MIAYVALGTNNFSRAVESCNQLLSGMWAQRVVQIVDSFVAWEFDANAGSLCTVKPLGGSPATARTRKHLNNLCKFD